MRTSVTPWRQPRCVNVSVWWSISRKVSSHLFIYLAQCRSLKQSGIAANWITVFWYLHLPRPWWSGAMSSASKFPRRCPNLFGLVPVESVFPSTISAVAMNSKVNLELISWGQSLMFLCCLIAYSYEQAARCGREAHQLNKAHQQCYNLSAEKCSAKSCTEDDGINRGSRNWVNH